MIEMLASIARRIFTTPYTPSATADAFLKRAQTQGDAQAEVTVAVLDAVETERMFGVALARRGVQPVYLKITNRSEMLLRLLLVKIDPNYYPPLEAAAVNHFSIVRRMAAFGFVSWFFPALILLFPPLLLVIPLKLITAYRANRRMDDFFGAHAFSLRPLDPGSSREGFVFTSLDAGTKVVHISLHASGNSLPSVSAQAPQEQHPGSLIEFVFAVPVPGISADYLRHDFTALENTPSRVDSDVKGLIERLKAIPPATTNTKGSRSGDPVNLVVVGDFETLLGAFAARWDECETITIATCWKTARSFLLGSQYRYSPVSALHLLGRVQDVALQRTRHTINERLHLRLWLSELRLHGKPVWVGQVSRDIGVRFTLKTWNLTTHRIDPDVDEARDYVMEDLLKAERIEAAGYVPGVGSCDTKSPRRNLTGDPYFTDGKRLIVLLSGARTVPRFVAW